MVDHNYRCIFIHQRKVAGSSIMAAFGKDQSMADWHAYNGGAKGNGWKNRKEPIDSYFVFSAVRNPFDRLISAWKYLPAFREMPLDYVLENLPKAGHDHRHLAVSQMEMLLDGDTNKLIVNDLIRFESLQDDFDRVCDRLGKPRVTLPLINPVCRQRDYRCYYTAKTRAQVENIFKVDLNYFGYAF